jgi:hypothetical protein
MQYIIQTKRILLNSKSVITREHENVEWSKTSIDRRRVPVISEKVFPYIRSFIRTYTSYDGNKNTTGTKIKENTETQYISICDNGSKIEVS